nr:dihydrolipoamide acetyltransferase [Casimicrobium sp.]
MAKQELKVPDIGDYTDIPVIEVLVKVGDVVTKEQSLVTLESDKATMEVPAESAGTIVELRVKLGDKVSMGTVVAVIEAGASASAPAAASAAAPAPAAAAAPAAAPAAGGSMVDVKVPDIGDFSDIPVIEILVKVGDTVKVEQS